MTTKRHLHLVRDFTPIPVELQPTTLAACQLAVRDWIVTTHGSPNQPESVAWWHDNISFFDREKMADWGAMGDGVGVASEGIFGWTNWCATDLGEHWHRQGIHLEPFNGWLLAVYLRQQ